MSASAIEERPISAPVAQYLRRFGRWSGAAAVLIGAVVLLGWAAGSELMRSFLPGQVSAKPNTALALILAGAAQWLSATAQRGLGRKAVRLLVACVVVISGATLLQFLLGRDFGIDQWFFREATGAVGTPYPGRMSLLATAEFLLFSAALGLWSWRRPRGERWAGWTALAGVSIALMVLLGYTFGAHGLYAIGWNTSIALPTALAFTLLFAGTLAAHPETGWIAVLASRGAGGVLLRRLLPLAIVAPWLIGWLSVEGSNAGLYSTHVDQVAVVLPLILLFVVFLFQSARMVDRLDEEREQRQREVEALNRELEARVVQRTEDLLAANEQLRESEARLKEAQRIAHLGSWELDLTRNLLSWSDETCRIFESDPRSPVSSYEAFLGAVHPDDRELVNQAYTESVRNRLPYEIVHRLLLPSGQVKYVQERCETSYDPAGRPLRSLGTVLDITERKRAEEAVEAERGRLRDVLDGLPVYSILLTRDYHVAFASQLFRERFGESQGRRCYEFLFGRSEPCENCETYKILDTKAPLRWKWTGPDGHHYDIYDRLFTDTDGSTLILEMGIDVTEQRRAEAALRQSEQRLRLHVQDAPVGVIEWDTEFRVMSWNPAAEQIFGYSATEAMGQHASFIVPASARQQVDDVWSALLRQKGGRRSSNQNTTKAGRTILCEWYNTPLTTMDGCVVGVASLVADITERKEAEVELQKQATMLHLAPAAIIVRDQQSRITFWSRGAEGLYGWAAAEVLGNLTHDLLQTGFPEPLEQIEAKLLSGRGWEGELQHTTRDGRRIAVASRWALQRDAQGEPEGFLEINVDITGRKRDELELQRLNRALKTLSRCSDAVARASDEIALLQRVCDLLVEIGGYPLAWVGYAEDDEQKTVTPVAVGGFGAAYVRNAHITWADTERGRGPTGIAIRSGQPCCIGDIIADPRFTPWREAALHHGYASVMAVPLKEGEGSFGALNLYAPEPNAFDREEQELVTELAATLSYGILALRARQERDQGAAELRRLNETLEHRVAERTAELAASTAEMEAFTYSVSHDLRAPLRHIDGFSRVLLDQCSEQLDDLGRHYLERVRHATQHMGRLVDDLLNLSHLGRRSLRVEEAPLGDIVREIAGELQADVGARSIEWRIAPLPVVNCDPNLIRQVFFNLLSNAVKFTRDRAPAVIEVGVEGDELFVRDNGVGFDAKYADKLFGVFQRLHRSEEFEGTGIGLATVRRILRKHGGDIHGEGALGKGATFHFTLGQPETVSAARDSEEIHAVP